MNPRVAKSGSSFKGAFLYYMHDKGAKTQHRVTWTHAVNILSDDPERAWQAMAFTARNHDRLKEASGQRVSGGRKLEKPVFAFSLSWHPDQKPSADHMRQTALAALKRLGLEEHEAMIIAHSDTPHRHVHIVANRVHPLTGKVASDSHTYRKLSDFALEYGKIHALDYSPQREENKKKREAGEKTAYRHPKIAEAWAASDNGKSLMAALEARGYTLAKGDRRLVVVSQKGIVTNPVRNIAGIKSNDFQDRLKDVNLDTLPDAAQLAAERRSSRSAKETNRLQAERSQAGKKKTEPAVDTPARKDHEKTKPDRQPAKKPKEAVTETKERTTPPSHEAEPANDQPNRAEAAAIRLNRIQDRHLQERADTFDKHHRRIEHEKTELSQYYRLEELGAKLEKLRVKCENPRLWRRLLGLARLDQASLETAKLNFTDARTRFDERIKFLEDERTSALDKLRVKQTQEWENALKMTVKPSVNERPEERTAPQNAQARSEPVRTHYRRRGR